jgi:DNA-binding GntR family transcriptional regulator
MSAGEVDALEGPIEDMLSCSARGDEIGFFEANTAFHEAFVVASGNLKLVEVYRRLIGQMGPYRRPSALLRGSLDRSIAEHQAILDAARARRGDRAAELMLDHIRVPQRRLDSLSDEEFAEENLLRSQQASPRSIAASEPIGSLPISPDATA